MTELHIAPFIESASDRIIGDDLIAGPQTYTITGAKGIVEDKKKRLRLDLDGSAKPFIPCKGMARLMGHLWGPDASKWIGKTVTLYRDPDVRFGADMTGGVRICAASNIDAQQSVPIRISQKSVKTYKVDPIAQPVGGSPRQDAAQKWADGYIAAIKAAVDAAALNAFVNSKAVKLTELEKARPDLHAECLKALVARRDSLSSEPDFSADDFTEAE